MEPRQYKILIVEDDTFMADIYLTKLVNSGFEVATAINGREAIEMLNENEKVPDLVLLDIIMPEMDGFDVLNAIRGQKKFADMKVILLTNLSQEKDIKEGLRLGANDYLIKSHFTPQEVLEKIHANLK